MANNSGSSFQKYVDMIPVSTDKLVGSAVSWFLKRHNPDDITLDLYQNGYQITVKTDKDNVKELKEFWDEFVQPNLGEENE